ncbi:hypothetical protein KGY71_07050, partial [Candidatus Bipolaricaulota bacterium]|nr:hypothetical protein [Candidatus Bipolaricaulota bacterium]
EPGEKTDVQVEVSVPEDPTPIGDHWAMLLVRGQQANPEEDSGMKVSVGYAVKILVEDQNAKNKSGKITNIQLANHNPMKISIEYLNNGTSYIKTEGSVEIRNLQGETEKTFEVKEFPTLPGEKRIIQVGMKNSSKPLDPGQYYAIVTMDYGGDHAIQGGRPIEIKESEPKEESSEGTKE